MMVRFIFKCKGFIRSPLSNPKVITYNMHENNVRRTDTKKRQFSRVLHYFNSFSQNQAAKSSIFSGIFLADNSSLRQVCRIAANNSSHNQRYYANTLQGGFHNKKALFENFFRFAPTIFNNRYQSTTATPVNEAFTVEISESADKPWFFSNSEGVDYVLKDISESPVAAGFQTLLENVHTMTGLPWWGTIILTTVMLRTLIILPLAVHQRHILIKLENAQREMEDVIYHTKQEISMAVKKLGWPVEYARTKYQEKVREEWNDVFRREKTHPIRACTLIAVQSTTWMGMSIALANMCCTFSHNDPGQENLYSEMTSGGLEWIQNLTVADSSLILPYSVGLLNLAIIGGLVLYWTISSGCGLVFNLFLTLPTIRKVLRIPGVKSDLQRKEEVAEWIVARQNSDIDTANSRKPTI
ncbi:cytochrome c oxidase assembly protein COX18, mitochondrial-like isoform X2 [Belonocnema kinseyi]|uniref:cytochrome c oxidase assembly protein COX18, mitochondrial-like isoform X2 n=1 Tax=Belonocnema kinseyi TaxID=2817044 RepID=UPI00143D6BD9|nr:cytochrome c oxidase assembly protein COX18, mitochondrial-like isoform X2 [Belonocnema kinseyi]